MRRERGGVGLHFLPSPMQLRLPPHPQTGGTSIKDTFAETLLAKVAQIPVSTHILVLKVLKSTWARAILSIFEDVEVQD